MTNFIRKNKVLLISVIAIIIVVAMTISIALMVHNKKLNELKEELVNELAVYKGTYDEQSIVLSNTNRVEAEKIAEKLNAKLRITNDGKYARLTLPEGVTIEDVYNDKENIEWLSKFSIDYHQTQEA